MQCACAVLSSEARPVVQYFPTLSHKRHNFRRKKMSLNTNCEHSFSLQLLSETLLILRRTDGEMTINVY